MNPDRIRRRQIDEQQMAAALHELAARLPPSSHPHTIALKFQVLTGRIVSGSQARRLMATHPPTERA